MRIKAVRKLSDRTIVIATNGNFAMPMAEHKVVQVLPKSRAFIGLRKQTESIPLGGKWKWKK